MPSDVKQDFVGRHVIRSGKQGGRWTARAFLGKDVSTDAATGETREEAIGKVRAALADMTARERSEAAPDGSPSARAYLAAFRRLGRLHKNHEAMLRAHFEAPHHEITATKLAAAAGYPNWNAANLQYGKLGEVVANEVGYDPPKRPDGTTIWTAALALAGADDEEDVSLDELSRVCARHQDNPHFHWTMRPQVVAALTLHWSA